MPKVRDYMTTPVVTITKNKSIAEAVEIMNKNNTDGLVIVEEKNNQQKVVGVVSIFDILSYLVPDYLEEDKHLASFEPSEVFTIRAKAIMNDAVSKCMTSNQLKTISKDHSLIEAATLMTEHKIHRLPVVDENNSLVGYLSKSDIQWALGKIISSQEKNNQVS